MIGNIVIYNMKFAVVISCDATMCTLACSDETTVTIKRDECEPFLTSAQVLSLFKKGVCDACKA